MDTGCTGLVLKQDNDGNTALHVALREGVSNGIIERLVDTGGRGLVVMKENDSNTALHIACMPQASSELNQYTLAVEEMILFFRALVKMGLCSLTGRMEKSRLTALSSI